MNKKSRRGPERSSISCQTLPESQSLHVLILQLQCCSSARNCLHPGCPSIISADTHYVYMYTLHLICVSSLLFLFTGPFFILPGMQSIWECRWNAKVFQHPLIEICFINLDCGKEKKTVTELILCSETMYHCHAHEKTRPLRHQRLPQTEQAIRISLLGSPESSNIAV